MKRRFVSALRQILRNQRRRRHAAQTVAACIESVESRTLLSAQIVTPTPESLSAGTEQAIEYSVEYQVEDPAAVSPNGLHLRMHYDSRQLTFVNISGVFAEGLQQSQDQPENDPDGDDTTDRQVNLLWLNALGDWPANASTPLTLLTAHFKTTDAFTDTTIQLTGGASPDYDFLGTPLDVQTVTLTDLDHSLGFDSVDEAPFDDGGVQEKWLTALNEEQYFLLPDGTLKKWDRTADSASGATVGRFGAAVYNDPSLLYQAYVSPVLEAARLDHRLGLKFKNSLYENHLGLNERWLYGETHETWYYVLPNGELYQHSGGKAVLEANLTPHHHAAPLALAGAQDYYLDTRYGLHTTGDFHTNSIGKQEKWLRGDDRAWFYVLPNGEFYSWVPGPDELLATLDTRHYEDPQRFADESAAAHLDELLGLQSGNNFRNSGGLGEVWLRDRDRAWYFVKPNGQIALWSKTGIDGVLIERLDTAYHDDVLLAHAAAGAIDREHGLSLPARDFFDTLTLQERWIRGQDSSWFYALPDGDLYRDNGKNVPATLVAHLGSDYYADLSKVTDADAAALDRRLGLHVANSLFENSRGQGEKWLRGQDRSWYILMPNGDMLEWDGGPGVNGRLVANIGVEYYETPDRLHNTRAYHLDRQLQLTSNGNYFENWQGSGERWVKDGSSTWYYILPDGRFYQWGGRSGKDQLVEVLDVSHFADPTTLHEAFSR